jgi:hypothetical protein
MSKLARSLRLVDVAYLGQLLESEDVLGPWRSYRSDIGPLPWQSEPKMLSTVQHAIDSVNNVADLVGADGQSIDKSSWTIDHHCARLLLFWSGSLTGPGGPLEMFKTANLEKKDYYTILFHFFLRVKVKKRVVVPNLLSPEPGVEILWQWLAAPGEPQNTVSRGVQTLTFNEAMKTMNDFFNLTSGGYEFVGFIHADSEREVFDEHGWVNLVHRLSRRIRCSMMRQVILEVHTIGPGFWLSSSAGPEVAVEDMVFHTFNEDNA